MNILVTGGMGFIGSSLVETLIRKGFSVTVLDSLTYAGRKDNLSKEIIDLISFRRIDISSGSDLEVFFSENRDFDVALNLAAESHVDRSILSVQNFINSNVLGTANLLTAYKNGVFGNFLQISTDEVYGSIANGSWDESSPLKPRSPYSASKASADLLCAAFVETYGLNITLTRCANNFGPRQAVEKFLPKVILSLLHGDAIPVYGDGKYVREWIYVQDHVNALLKLMSSGLKGFNTFNLGGTSLTNLELVDLASSILNMNANIKFVDDRLGHDRRYSVNDLKYQETFGALSNSTLDTDLRETIKWYQENENWVNESIKRTSN
jgi:dTDP-glucose 4,6-dehydratase